MPRAARVAPGGFVYHVVNRGNDGRRIFKHDGDYYAFLSAMRETQARVAMRILAYCLMPNHWHLLLWPADDGNLGIFMQRLTTMHVADGISTVVALVGGTCIKARTSPSSSRRTTIFLRSPVMSNVMR